MKFFVINLDRCIERLTRFQEANRFFPYCERFPAVDGSFVNRRELLEAGTVEHGLAYTDGALGCALSHMALWRSAVSCGSPTTVIEDDAVLNRNFAEQSAKVLKDLADWDCVLWGWNFDSPFVVDLLPGVSPALIKFDQDSLRRNLTGFQAMDIKPMSVPLLRAFGTLCYSVSVRGAERLLAACTPLRPLSLAVPGMDALLLNVGLDVMMNAFYPQLRAFAAFPPLAVSLNDAAASSVKTR